MPQTRFQQRLAMSHGLLVTDAQQLRLHLNWLLKDLVGAEAEAVGEATVALAARASICLEHLAHLDDLVARV